MASSYPARKKPGTKQTSHPATETHQHLEVVYRLNALLHTMRLIEIHEEQLCSIMNEIRTSGTLDGPLFEDLQHLIEELPAWAYQADLEAMREAVTHAAPAAKTKKSAGSALSRRSGASKR